MQQKSQQNLFDYDDSDSANEIIVSLLNIQHDSQFDYYGKKVSTCNNKGKISIYEIIENRQHKSSEIKNA